MYQPVKRMAGQGSARPQRLFQILTVLYERRFEQYDVDATLVHGGDATMTTNEIAKQCGLKASPHFRGLLDELLGGGHLAVLPEQYRVNMMVYKWQISDRARWSEDWKAAFDAWLEPAKVLA